MLDIKFIRENKEKIEEAARNKHIKIDIGELLKVDDERKKLQQETENINARRNKIAKDLKNGKPSKEQIEEGKKLKIEVGETENKLKEVEKKYISLMVKVPTIPSPDTPIGKDRKSVV